MTAITNECPYCRNAATLGAVYYDQNCVCCVKRMTAAPDPANSYARSIAVALHASHYPEVTQWRPLDDTMGLLTQIDNMTCALVRAETAPTVVEPDRAMNAFTDAADLVDAMRQSKNNGEAVALVLKYRNACIAATPPRAALTREQISELAVQEELLLICDNLDALVEIVAVVEQAHGIGRAAR